MKKTVFQIIILLLLISCQKEVYYTVSTAVNPKEAGTVSVSPAEPSVLEGSSITFTAQPKGDYVFTGWSGSFSGTENPKTVTVISDMVVTANFTLKEYPLTVRTEGDGTVSERVISTKTDYSSGTVVELTATPGTGWSFDHWEGDLTGADNPITITISSVKAVKAVFTKNQYAYNLKIIGPGVVNEEIVETKSLEYGTLIKLTAIPNIFENAVFVGWKGDIESFETAIVVSMDSNKSITAVFKSIDRIRTGRLYPLPNLNQPSHYLRSLYPDEWFAGYSDAPYQRLVIDYNRDGYLDLITACYVWSFGGKTDSDRIPVRFYLGNPDGTLSIDEINDNRIMGPLHVRTIVCGDYNMDGLPDIALLGHGYDTDPTLHIDEYINNPYPGEYPILLMSMPGGYYKDVRITELDGGFFHGGASGDYDNDGDLDIFLCDNFGHPGFLVNDGLGYFTYNTDIVEKKWFNALFNADLYDIDNDGYLDLICGGHDWEDKDYYEKGDVSYTNTPIVFWGNGTSYNGGEKTRLPETRIEGFGLTCSFTFYDLDSDGIEEVILARTGDGVRGTISYYAGWAIQILSRDGRSFNDVTEKYLNLNESFIKSDAYREWLCQIDFAVSQIDGKTYLCGAYDDRLHLDTEKLFELSNQRLYPVKQSRTEEAKGLCVYADGFIGVDYYGNNTNISSSYDEISYSGDLCIHWTAEEAWSQCITRLFPKVDMRPFVNNGYELEFYIKYSTPHLSLCINLETSYSSYIAYVNPNLNQNTPPVTNNTDTHRAYGYGFFNLPEINADGEWHRIHVPLSDFYNCDGCDDTGWEAIQLFKMWVISEDTVGAEFYIDEIRIRKVLPE